MTLLPFALDMNLEIGCVTGMAEDQVTEWLWTYNNDRPNMVIGGITPAMKLKTAA